MLTPSEIEAMAYEAGDDGGDFHVDRAWLTRFATLVAAKARAEAMEDQTERVGKKPEAADVERWATKRERALWGEVGRLKEWIRHTSEANDVCVFNVLREICPGCRCSRSEQLAAAIRAAQKRA